MAKIIFNIGKVVVLISIIATVAGFFMLNNPRSFESGSAFVFYGFLAFVTSAVITLIMKIVVSQRA